MEDSERPEYQLKRVLGPFQLILFGIGAGLFATIGTAAAGDAYRPGAGPALMVGIKIVVLTFFIIIGFYWVKPATEQAEPLTMALQHAAPNLGWAVGIVAFGSVIAPTAVLLIFQLGQPRIFFSMSRDGLLPKTFSRVHKRFRTPHVATILTGVFVAMFAAWPTRPGWESFSS